jgi:type IV pilus assembly protein PilV
MKITSHTPHQQRGATLIEVLVSMVILAIALLGMAALTTASIKYDNMSRARGTALSLVTDYAERARANLIGFDNTSNPYEITTAYAVSTSATDPTLSACTVTAGSTAQNTCATAIASYDKQQWLNTVASRLPSGGAYIDTTNFTYAGTTVPKARTMNIWLIWKDQQQASGFSLSQACPSGAGIDRTKNPEIVCMFFRVSL